MVKDIKQYVERMPPEPVSRQAHFINPKGRRDTDRRRIRWWEQFL